MSLLVPPGPRLIPSESWDTTGKAEPRESLLGGTGGGGGGQGDTAARPGGSDTRAHRASYAVLCELSRVRNKLRPVSYRSRDHRSHLTDTITMKATYW